MAVESVVYSTVGQYSGQSPVYQDGYVQELAVQVRYTGFLKIAIPHGSCIFFKLFYDNLN